MPYYNYQYQPPPIVPYDVNHNGLYVAQGRGSNQAQRVVVYYDPNKRADTDSDSACRRGRYYRRQYDSSESSTDSSCGTCTESSEESVRGIFWNALRKIGDRFYHNLYLNQDRDSSESSWDDRCRYSRYPRRYYRAPSTSSSASLSSSASSSSSDDSGYFVAAPPRGMRKGEPREQIYRRRYRKRRNERRLGFWEKIFGY